MSGSRQIVHRSTEARPGLVIIPTGMISHCFISDRALCWWSVVVLVVLLVVVLVAVPVVVPAVVPVVAPAVALAEVL
eukprot:9102733-Pyramimonas_sp.AAC.1